MGRCCTGKAALRPRLLRHGRLDGAATCRHCAWHGRAQVIFSDSSEPGEGEHKILRFIRQQRTQVCVRGWQWKGLMLQPALQEAGPALLSLGHCVKPLNGTRGGTRSSRNTYPTPPCAARLQPQHAALHLWPGRRSNSAGTAVVSRSHARAGQACRWLCMAWQAQRSLCLPTTAASRDSSTPRRAAHAGTSRTFACCGRAGGWKRCWRRRRRASRRLRMRPSGARWVGRGGGRGPSWADG